MSVDCLTMWTVVHGITITLHWSMVTKLIQLLWGITNPSPLHIEVFFSHHQHNADLFSHNLTQPYK